MKVLFWHHVGDFKASIPKLPTYFLAYITCNGIYFTYC